MSAWVLSFQFVEKQNRCNVSRKLGKWNRDFKKKNQMRFRPSFHLVHFVLESLLLYHRSVYTYF